MFLKASPLPPIELVEVLFSYDPISGNLTNLKSGTIVRNNDRTTGYMKVRCGRTTTQAARIAWLLYYREDPIGYRIHHINGDKQDNRICNLRKVREKRAKSKQ